MNYIKTVVIFLGLIFALTFLVNNRHANNGEFNWRGELWADQAGYYIYLPSLFIYNFDINKIDPSIVEKTGKGFFIDTQEEKILTKYTCGVAILQAPFFAIVHFYQKIRGNPTDGFSGLYHQIPNFSAILYTALALLLLFYFLKNYFSTIVSISTIASLFFGTNLYYYAIDHTGMSHVYSFFLFALALNLMWQLIYKPSKYQTRNFVLWSCCVALIILIRPTNVLFVAAMFLLDCTSNQAVVERFKLFLNAKFISLGLLCLFIVFLPQFLYWRYSSGSILHYSYGNESFSNWRNPQLAAFWLAPNNGLFLYSPILVLLPFISFVMAIKKIKNGLAILSTFFVLSYISASWYIYSFGCGFGSRNFVEYNALFSLPFGYLINWVSQKKYTKWALGFVIILSVFTSQKLIFTYDKCFFGTGDWDWSEYKRLLTRGYHHQVAVIEAANFPNNSEYIGELIIKPSETWTIANYERVWLQALISTNNIHSKTSLVIETYYQSEMIQWQNFEIKNQLFEKDKPTKVLMDFTVKKDLNNRELYFKVYIWNPDKVLLDIQKLEVFMK